MTTEQLNETNELTLDTVLEQNVPSEECEPEPEPEPEPDTPDVEPINFKKVVCLFEEHIKKQRLLRYKDEPKEDNDIEDGENKDSVSDKTQDLNAPINEVREDVNDNVEKGGIDAENKSNNEKEDDAEEEEEEEEEETEMTEEEKEEMYRSVCAGDIACFQNLLDKPNADINMTWFKENLLMVAMRTGQFKMAEFLIDIGIDCNYEIDLIDVQYKEKFGTRYECFRKSCRQIAYEQGLEFMVDMIDLKNNNWFRFKKQTPREPFSRRPYPPPLPPIPGEEEEVEEEEDLVEIADEQIDSVSVADKTAKDSKGKLSARSKTTDSGRVSGKFDGADDGLSSCSSDSFNRKREGRDDGYETMTPLSSPYHSFAVTEGPKERPGLLSRGTKASLSIKKHTNQVINARKYSKSAKNRPVARVQTVGSYARESRLWQTTKSKAEPEEDVSYLAQNKNRLVTGKSTSDSKLKIRTQSAVVSHNGRLTQRQQYRQRPLSSPPSALSQISKILGESKLLRPQKNHSLPFINPTHQTASSNGKLKLNPWCHSNSSGVFNKLTDVKIQNNIQNSGFQVNRQLFERSRTFHSLHT